MTGHSTIRYWPYSPGWLSKSEALSLIFVQSTEEYQVTWPAILSIHCLIIWHPVVLSNVFLNSSSNRSHYWCLHQSILFTCEIKREVFMLDLFNLRDIAKLTKLFFHQGSTIWKWGIHWHWRGHLILRKDDNSMPIIHSKVCSLMRTI